MINKQDNKHCQHAVYCCQEASAFENKSQHTCKFSPFLSKNIQNNTEKASYIVKFAIVCNNFSQDRAELDFQLQRLG
jgi:hypothetical protein